NLDYYKVYIAQANGSGEFGETISEPAVESPGVGSTETFLSIGRFQTLEEAYAVKKYIKTKFTRALLSVLKVTQNGNKPVWKYVPLQDFTENSDIDWSKSVHEIDLQLYRKYNLDEKEIEFIESHVKEMA
ncbi:MAG: restriction endonuclease, partial [Clostridia bacterium]|nr:restriction endonuclease [Clostridia bacterium]